MQYANTIVMAAAWSASLRAPKKVVKRDPFLINTAEHSKEKHFKDNIFGIIFSH